MLTAFNQNWRTTNVPHSLSLANTVSTGGSFSTPSGAIQNSKIWASAGFRGFGPVMTYPGAGMDNVQGLGGGCGCGCSHGLGQLDLFSSWDISTWGFGEWALLGLGLIGLWQVFSTGKRGAQAVTGAVSARRAKAQKRAKLKAEMAAL